MDRGPGNLADDKPIEAYWCALTVPSAFSLSLQDCVCEFLCFCGCRLHIDPVCLEQERAKGHAEPREELGMIESVSFG